jgi:hypothetical protein
MLQILIAILLVIILFVIGFSVYNAEFINSIRRSGVNKIKIPIFEGIKDLYTVSNEEYNTSNKKSGSFKALNDTPSYNQAAGSEYTYNFWIYKDGSKYRSDGDCKQNDKNNADMGFGLHETDTIDYTYSVNGSTSTYDQTILFLKGNKDVIEYNNICGKKKKDIMIKNPLVKFEQCGRNLTVEFNTLKNKDVVIENSPDVCGSAAMNWQMGNAHKVTLGGFDHPKFDKKWHMVTIVIQDTYPTDPQPLRNKVRCRIYVNTVLELDKYVDGIINTINDYNKEPTVLKLNKGHLHIMPIITVDGKTTYVPKDEKALMMANLSYFNYALTPGDIDSLFSEKFKLAMAPTPDGTILKGNEYEYASKPIKKQFY